ncbi:MAG: hydrogenase maturation protease [bacterium]
MSELGERIGALVGGRSAAVVGVGNRLRGDDGVGSHVADRLRGRLAAAVYDVETVPENYLGVLTDAAPGVVLFVDAAAHGGPPGAWCLAPAGELASRSTSTHAMSLLLLARALEARGIACWLIGVQPDDTEFGAPLTSAVAAGADTVEDALIESLGAPEVLHA